VIPDVNYLFIYLFIYLYVSLLAGLHKKLQADLAKIFREG